MYCNHSIYIAITPVDRGRKRKSFIFHTISISPQGVLEGQRIGPALRRVTDKSRCVIGGAVVLAVGQPPAPVEREREVKSVCVCAH